MLLPKKSCQMIILRIGNVLFFASNIVSDSLMNKAEKQGIDKPEFDQAFLQFVFHLESCSEAIEVFDEFDICPVCGAIASEDGVFIHKDPAEFTH